MNPETQNAPLGPLKMVVGVMAAGCAIIGVTASMIMPPPEDPPTLMQQLLPVLIPLVTAAVAWAYLSRPPKATGELAPDGQAMGLLRTRTMMAAAITEAGGLLAFGFGFAFDFVPLAVTIAMILAAVLVLAVAWPRASRLAEWERELRRTSRR